MRLQKIGITCIAIINLAVFASVTVLPVVQVLAQTTASRKAEADRLFNQGKGQFQTSQFQAALQSLQKALAIYQAIHDRLGEGSTDAVLAATYLRLGEKTRGLEYSQQSLVIAKETKNQKLEAVAQQLLLLAQTQGNPKKVEADRLWQEGFRQYQTNQFQEALHPTFRTLNCHMRSLGK